MNETKKVVLIEDEWGFVELWKTFMTIYFPSVIFEVIGERAELTLLKIAQLAAEENTFFILDNRLWGAFESANALNGPEIAGTLVRWGFPVSKILFSTRDSYGGCFLDTYLALPGKIPADQEKWKEAAILVRKFLGQKFEYGTHRGHVYARMGAYPEDWYEE